MNQLTAVLSVAGIATFSILNGGPRRASESSGHSTKSPVLVELFTSEGCSSCPPADKLLEALAKNQAEKGVDVIVMSEHVDYWNNNGWRDPYSASQFSARQAGYIQAFHIDSSYTPQMVVDGQSEFVGSDEDRADNAIELAAKKPKASINLELDRSTASKPILSLTVKAATATAGVWLAITEDDLRSSVSRGENAGRRLTHVGVVRELRQIGSISPGTTFTKGIPVDLSPQWNRQKVKLVAFVQEPGQRKVLGVASVRLAG